jgi:hypothetical protein
MNYVQFANFHLKFGSKDMLDYLSEVVIPAFVDDTFVRSIKSGRTKYFFYNAKFEYVEVDNGDGEKYFCPVIHGQFIKDTELFREQVFDEDKGIVETSASIQSSPSAYFVLRLEDHRLLFYPETSFPPSTSEFRATAQKSLERSYDKFIRSAKNRLNAAGSRITIKEMESTHRKPSLKILNLPNQESLAKSVHRFKDLTRVEIEIVHTNSEPTLDDLLIPAQKRNDRLSKNGDATTRILTAAPNGLNKDEVEAELSDFVQQGVAQFTLSGKGDNGEKIVVESEELALRYPMETNVLRGVEKVAAMMRRFFQGVQDGAIQTGIAQTDVLARIRAIVGRPPL